MAKLYMALIRLPIMKDGKYGEFLRYGIGGELQNPFAAFAHELLFADNR